MEKIPFQNDQFDFVFALGVFDCTQQDAALAEMLRVSKIGGKILLTGKNHYYNEDDDEAKAAEMGARAKGEPNYFTNYSEMCLQIANNQHSIIDQKLFKYRGDFAYLDNQECNIGDRFYEFILVVEKCSANINFTNFSSSKSKVYIHA